MEVPTTGLQMALGGKISVFGSPPCMAESRTAPPSPGDSEGSDSPPWSVAGACGTGRAPEVITAGDMELYEQFDAVHYVDASPAGGLITGMAATGSVPGHGVVALVMQLPGGDGIIREVVCRRSSSSVVRGAAEGTHDAIFGKLGPCPAHVCHFRLVQAGIYNISCGDDDGRSVTIVVAPDDDASASSGVSVDGPSSTDKRKDASLRLATGGAWGVPVEGASWEGSTSSTGREGEGWGSPVEGACWGVPPSTAELEDASLRLATGVAWGIPIEGACWGGSEISAVDDPVLDASSSPCSATGSSRSSKQAAKKKAKNAKKNKKRAACRVKAFVAAKVHAAKS